MKKAITIETEEDLLGLDDNDDQNRVMFCVTERTARPWYDNDNYRRISWSDPETHRADSISDLYEQMAKIRVEHTLKGEDECRRDSQLDVDDFTVEFSPIFVEVESFSEARLLDTDTYKNMGAARDRKRAQEKGQRDVEEERRRKYEAARREENDKAEFDRLSKKFGTSPLRQ